MPLTTFAAGRLFGARHGTGRPWVLALHGWSRSHRDFDAVLDGLDALALDLPGFGAAPAPPQGWSTAEYGRWIAPVLDEMAQPVVVLGHSFGGRVAVHLGAAASERVAALVLSGVPLVDPAGTSRRRPPAAFRAGRALYRAGLIGDARMAALRHRHGSPDYRASAGVMREVLVKAVGEDGRYGPVLGSYGGPVELVWGQADTAAPVGMARAAAEAYPQANLQILGGVDHFTPQHAPDAIRAALDRHRR